MRSLLQHKMTTDVRFGHQRDKPRCPGHATLPSKQTWNRTASMSAHCRTGHRSYSITSSARARSVGVIVRPSALAVTKLTIKSN